MNYPVSALGKRFCRKQKFRVIILNRFQSRKFAFLGFNISRIPSHLIIFNLAKTIFNGEINFAISKPARPNFISPSQKFEIYRIFKNTTSIGRSLPSNQNVQQPQIYNIILFARGELPFALYIESVYFVKHKTFHEIINKFFHGRMVHALIIRF